MVFSSEMVCEKCEKKGKLGKVINPDPWKAGSSNNTTPGAAGGSRKVKLIKSSLISSFLKKRSGIEN